MRKEAATSTWNDAAWAEGNLLRLIVEVADRCVNHHLANGLPGEQLLIPVLHSSDDFQHFSSRYISDEDRIILAWERDMASNT